MTDDRVREALEALSEDAEIRRREAQRRPGQADRWWRVWQAIEDPGARPEPPGAAAARQRRLVSAYREERARRGWGWSGMPVGLRLASPAALLAGALFGWLAASSLPAEPAVPKPEGRLAQSLPPDVGQDHVDLARELGIDAPSDLDDLDDQADVGPERDLGDELTPPTLAELYLQDLGLANEDLGDESSEPTEVPR